MEEGDILGSGPVAEVGEVGDEGRVLEELFGGEMVEIERGGEQGDEFEFEGEAGRVVGGLGRRWR